MLPVRIPGGFRYTPPERGPAGRLTSALRRPSHSPRVGMRLRLGLLDILSILKGAAECGNAGEDGAGHGGYAAHKCELSYFFATPLIE